MSERQTLTWAACDALAANGKKPSIGLVREWTIATTGVKKGSDGDVQRDIHRWYDDLLKLKRDKAVEGLPDAVSALARDFWRLAIDAANDSLASERETLEKEKAEAEKLIDLAKKDTVAAVEIANQLKGKLAIAHETIVGRDETIKRLEESLSEARAKLAAKDERLAGVTAELARKAEEHAAGLAELEGLRKHTLLQIDQARGETRHWKIEFECVQAENKSAAQTYQQKTSALETELAAARGRLGAVEEALAAATARVVRLEGEVAATKTSVAVGGGKHRLAAPGREKMLVRRRKNSQ